MAGLRINLSHAGMEHMLKSDGVAEVLLNHAEHILSEAERYAPVVSGAYRESLKIDSVETDRATVRVVADIRYGMAVEAARGVLGRARGGLARSISRDRARTRAAERRYDRQVAAEESGGER